MNPKLLWMLFNGQLGYLRQEWKSKTGVDPLKDHLMYLFAVSALCMLVLLCFVLMVIGLYNTVSHIEIQTAVTKSEVKLICFVSTLAGSFILFCFFGWLTGKFIKLSRTEWLKSHEFIPSIKILIDFLVTESGHRHLKNRYILLMGNGEEILSPSFVPNSIAFRIRKIFVSWAKDIITHASNPTTSVELRKAKLKAGCRAAYYVGLLRTEDPKPIYKAAKKELAE